MLCQIYYGKKDLNGNSMKIKNTLAKDHYKEVVHSGAKIFSKTIALHGL